MLSSCVISVPLVGIAIFLVVVLSLSRLARALAVFIHEMGHWLMAKALGATTPIFSLVPKTEPHRVIGQIFGTEVRIGRVFPVSSSGGYVSLRPPQDRQADDPVIDTSLRRAFLLQLLLVSLAGPLANLVVVAAVLWLLRLRIGFLLVGGISALCHVGIMWFFVSAALLVLGFENYCIEGWVKDFRMATESLRALTSARAADRLP